MPSSSRLPPTVRTGSVPILLGPFMAFLQIAGVVPATYLCLSVLLAMAAVTRTGYSPRSVDAIPPGTPSDAAEVNGLPLVEQPIGGTSAGGEDRERHDRARSGRVRTSHRLQKRDHGHVSKTS